MAGEGRPSTCWGALALAVDPRNQSADEGEGVGAADEEGAEDGT